MLNPDLPNRRLDCEAADCLWCDKTLGPDYLTDRSVCMRCIDLMRGANIPDSEIFGGADPDVIE